MKGIIFTEFFELVEDAYGMDMLDDIIEACDLPSGGSYTAVGTYDHAEIVALVSALSEKIGVEVPDLLLTYGTFLFGRFVEKYPIFFTDTTDAFSFLKSVGEYIHVEVKKLYPDAELPDVRAETREDGTLLVTYFSSRHFEDVAHGLILGCLEHFGEPCKISQTGTDSANEGIRFILEKVS